MRLGLEHVHRRARSSCRAGNSVTRNYVRRSCSPSPSQMHVHGIIVVPHFSDATLEHHRGDARTNLPQSRYLPRISRESAYGIEEAKRGLLAIPRCQASFLSDHLNMEATVKLQSSYSAISRVHRYIV